MSHQVALTFEDGVTRFIRCESDQTVADASYRARINIPLDCRDGACGTCKAFCESGEYDGGTYIDDALTADEAAQGFALPCSMKPRSDLVLRIAGTSTMAKTETARYTGTITRVGPINPTTYELAIRVEHRDGLHFLPGQYVNITVPGTTAERSYSFSNSTSDEELTFLVKITPGGVMSEFLTERAAVGDPISFTGPNGTFFLREDDSPLLLLAGGTGLAPVLSIMRRLHESESKRPVHLVYGVTTDDDLVDLGTIDALASGMSMTWDYCVADRTSSHPKTGYVTSYIGPEHHRNGAVSVYLCGPPPMVDAVREHFQAIGITPTAFHFERFALAVAPGVNAQAPVEPPASASNTVADSEEAEVENEVAGHETAAAAVVDGVGAPLEPVVVRSDATPAPVSLVDRAPVGRRLCGQEIFPARAASPSNAGGPVSATTVLASRSIAGQETFAAARTVPVRTGAALDHLPPTRSRRGIAGQEMFARRDADPTRIPSAPAQTPIPPMRFLSPGRFGDKIVLLTGGAQGIGAHVARRIAAEGGTLLLADRSEFVDEVRDQLEGGPDRHGSILADLETWDGAQRAVDAAIERHGRIDIAIHAVGGTIWQRPFQSYEPDQIKAEIRRSLFPTLWATRAVAPHMIARRSGTIVNVSSTATRGIHRVPYSAAKGGVNALTASLAFELGAYGIRVVGVAPGGTDAPPRRIQRGPLPDTELERKWADETVAQVVDSTLLKRYGTLDEQASAIAFAASDEASYITGDTIPVSGGDLG